jgi:Helix-turn-helix domain of resolvase/Resolvase, N terminal domain
LITSPEASETFRISFALSGPGRGHEGHRAADRHRHGGRQVLLDMLGVFAEFETNLRRERQLEGIAKAKVAGVYKGRPPSIEASRVREMKAQGIRPVDIAKALKIGRASVYRVLAAAEASRRPSTPRLRRTGTSGGAKKTSRPCHLLWTFVFRRR